MQFVPPIQCQFCGGSHKEWESVQACGEARARQLKPDPKDARISALTAEVERLRSQLELVRKRLGGAPEINPCNYDHDEVVELSSACILAYFLAGGKPTNEEVPEYKQAQAELLDAARGRQG